MLLAQQKGCGDGRDYPLVLGGISIIASIIGMLLRARRPGGSVMGALYQGVFGAAVISAIAFYPRHRLAVRRRCRPTATSGRRPLSLLRSVGLVVTAC